MQTQPVPHGSAPCGRADHPPVGAGDGASPGSVASISDAHRGYLDAAVARCRLPIFVSYTPIGDWDQWLIADISRDAPVKITPDDDEARAAYLDLCRSLSAPGTSPVVDADTAAGASL